MKRPDFDEAAAVTIGKRNGKNMAERNCDNGARGELKELLLFMLQGAVHLLTCAAGQALLWVLIIWHYDLTPWSYVGSCGGAALLIALDFCVSRKLTGASMRLGHLTDLLLVLPSIAVAVQCGTPGVFAAVAVLDAAAVTERVLLVAGLRRDLGQKGAER